MARPQPIIDPCIQQLDQATFAGLNCREHGIIALEGAKSWGVRDSGTIELPSDTGSIYLPLAHDERGGPYVRDRAGMQASSAASDGNQGPASELTVASDDPAEQRDLLISLTDQGNTIACLWARLPQATRIKGIGIDLTASKRFAKRPGGRRDLATLLLTEQERSLAHRIASHDLPHGYATLFAAKEAAFKATAAPLRTWYRTHDEQLRFEVRHFVMEELGVERGTGRDGAAQRAMDLMGIERIVIHHVRLGDMALVTAVALGS